MFFLVIREVYKYLSYQDRVSLSLTNWLAFRLLIAETSRCIVWSLGKSKGSVPKFHRPFKFVEATKTPLFQSPSGASFLCITHLAFSNAFIFPIPPGSIPNMVTHLVLSKAYTESLDRALPRGLRSLAFHTHDSHYARRSFEHEDACVALRNSLRYVVCVEVVMLETFVLDSLSPDPFAPQPSPTPSLPPHTYSAILRPTTIPPTRPSSSAPSCARAWLRPQLRFPATFTGMHYHSIVNKKKTKFQETLRFSLAQLPSGLTHLTLPRYFDMSLDGALPGSLTYLSLGRYFNHPLNHLPALTHLLLGESFQHPITHLPVTLRHLVVKGEPRNQHGKLDLTYLTNLTHIHFTSHHHSLCRLIASLPSSVVYVSSAPFFWDCALNTFSTPTPFTLLPNLTYLRGLCTRYSGLLSFTPNLTHLLMKGSLDNTIVAHQIPESVTHLSLENCWIDSIHCHFPCNLVHLAVKTFQRSTLETISKIESLSSLLLQIEMERNRHVDFRPPLPPNLIHLSLLFWRPRSLKIQLTSPSLTHLTIAPNVESEPSELATPSFSLTLTTPHLTHLDAQLTTRHIRPLLSQLLDPSLCPLPNLTHLTLGKSHEIQQVCRFPPKLSLLCFPRLSHLRLQDHAHLHVKQLPPDVSHLALGRLSIISKKLSGGKVTHVSWPSDHPPNQVKRIHKLFQHADFIVQDIHKVKFHKQNVYWRYSFD